MYRYVVAPCFFANQLIRLRCILNPQNWVQETCLHIQAAALREASLYFHRGLRQCFTNDYAFLFDSPVNGRIDNDASGHSSIYIPAAGS